MLRLQLLLIIGIIGIAGGCGAGLRPPSGIAGAPAPPAAVERFLQLAAERDYAAMGWIFGTSDGPIMERDPASQVEQRMYALASLLDYESFVLGNGRPVPGRTGDAMEFNVQLSRGGQVTQVPFTTVRGPGQRWFVEQLDVEAITGL